MRAKCNLSTNKNGALVITPVRIMTSKEVVFDNSFDKGLSNLNIQRFMIRKGGRLPRPKLFFRKTAK